MEPICQWQARGREFGGFKKYKLQKRLVKLASTILVYSDCGMVDKSSYHKLKLNLISKFADFRNGSNYDYFPPAGHNDLQVIELRCTLSTCNDVVTVHDICDYTSNYTYALYMNWIGMNRNHLWFNGCRH